jgi:hypothetical protein
MDRSFAEAGNGPGQMKRPRPLPAGPGQRLRRKTQRTTPSTPQPKRVVVELRTMHTELFMDLAIAQGLCTIKSKCGCELNLRLDPEDLLARRLILQFLTHVRGSADDLSVPETGILPNSLPIAASTRASGPARDFLLVSRRRLLCQHQANSRRQEPCPASTGSQRWPTCRGPICRRQTQN